MRNIIILSLFAIAFVVLGIKNINERFGKVMLMLGVGYIVFTLIGAGLKTALFTPNADFYGMILIIFAVLLFILALCAALGKLKKKVVYIPICICAAVCLIATGGYFAYQKYVETIPTVGENDDLLGVYAPYAENTLVVSLEEESTLRVSGDVPVMDGATALYPVYSAFAKATYPKEIIQDDSKTMDTNENTHLKCTTTSRAYRNIVDGSADIIFAAEPSEDQKLFAAESGVEFVYTPIGKEAFVFFVNAQNPIEDISLEDIQKIYSGEITSWNEFNVNGLGRIKAFQRNEGSGSQSALLRLMNGKNLVTPPKEEVVGGMIGIIQKTSDYKNFRNAIGYSFRFYSTEMVKNNQIKLLSINGVEPTVENIENGTYPMSSYFYAVTRSDADENTQKLLEWILSEQGQEIIERTGYTPLR